MSAADPVIGNLYEFFSLIETSSEAVTISNLSNGYESIQCEDSTWPNFIYQTAGQVDLADVDELEKEHSFIPGTLLLTDGLDASSLEKFQDRGYLHAARWTKFSIECTGFKVFALDTVPDLQIDKLRNQQELKIWIDLAREGYGDLGDDYFQALLGSDSCDFQMAYVQDEPAAIIMSFMHETTVGLYFLYVRKPFRKSGIALLLTQVVLRNAALKGSRVAIGHARGASWPIMDKLNGKNAGSIDLFWPPFCLPIKGGKNK